MANPHSVRATRHIMKIGGKVVTSEGHSRDAPVLNISVGGCCVRGYYRRGLCVNVQIPRIGTFPGTVVWASRGEAGISFERTLS